MIIRRFQGHVSAALVLGGVDVEGAHIFTVYPHGSVDRLPYAAMGSGELAAMSVFESGYKEDLEVVEWVCWSVIDRERLMFVRVGDRRKRQLISWIERFNREYSMILGLEAMWIFASFRKLRESI